MKKSIAVGIGIAVVGVLVVSFSSSPNTLGINTPDIITTPKSQIVTQIVDGDTIKVDGKSIRFALASAPELSEAGGIEARKFIEIVCPVGSPVIIDEDSGQPEGSYGRVLAVVYCNGINLNAEILDARVGTLSTEFCSVSEFANDDWAQKHGCENIQKSSSTTLSEPKIFENTPIESKSKSSQPDCDSSYPDVCIPSYPPDLDCGEIPFKKFTVLQPDPHRFDGDKDGIGCET